MKSRYMIMLFGIILILVYNIQLISCIPNNIDLELGITNKIFNSNNIIIDLTKELNIKNNYYIKILSYEKELELYSTQNLNKKIKPFNSIW